MMGTLVVVGAGLAGVRAAESARAAGFGGRLVLLGAEAHAPYDRPPLSKDFLTGERTAEQIGLATPESLAAQGIELHSGRPARGLDLTARRVLLDGGEQPFDRLVVATGARPRTLPGVDPEGRLLYLRSLEQARRLAERLAAARRLLVVGGGLVGCEVAALARGRLGLDVTLVEPQAGPMLRAVGGVFSALCADLHARNGVDLRCKVGVRRIEGRGGRGIEASLSRGGSVTADVAMAGVGAVPDVGWLEGSGLELCDGVLCDATLTTTHPDVVAAGDVARYRPSPAAAPVRHEHWTNAVQQGRHAGRQILRDHGDRERYADTGYFWSQQYDRLVQGIGDLQGAATIRERSADGQVLGVTTADERVTGAFAIGKAREFALLRASGAAERD